MRDRLRRVLLFLFSCGVLTASALADEIAMPEEPAPEGTSFPWILLLGLCAVLILAAALVIHMLLKNKRKEPHDE